MDDPTSAGTGADETPGAGYRLVDLQLFNWGTFDQRVWRFSPRGATALVTGDIGSGKSTLVDALTTLLLPAHRVAYNKAAGAESRERTLRSYVEGHYKSERSESTGTSRPVGLRQHNSYSVVLGTFRNDGHDETVTLAQVFHQRERTGQPDRFFVTATRPMEIEVDFADFGSDLKELRRRLRAAGATISNTYPEYSQHLRRLLGIRSDQALDLFHQTVSMKSVGNLNDFVRHHMLEPVDATDRVTGIVTHFEDLARAHAAVRRAQEQLEALDPLVVRADRYEAAVAHKEDLARRRDSVRLYFAELRVRLLTEEETALTAQRHSLTTRLDRAQAHVRELADERDALIARRAAEGGDRLQELDAQEATAAQQAAERRTRRERFDRHVKAAGFAATDSAEAFACLPARVTGKITRAHEHDRALREQAVDLATRRREISTSGTQIRGELDSLATRANNLPHELLGVRESLSHDLGIDPANIPFAGELIDITAGHEDWRGAAERVLRGFALSLLVPHDLYPQISQWVNARRLTAMRGGRQQGMRLVYERVPHQQVRLRPADSSGGLVLAETLDVADGPFESYLTHQLARRADHRCVLSVEEFQHEQRAVTREGQVRSRDRHEKDDRSRVDDPRRWVLGWQNDRKIAALTEQLTALQEELTGLEETERDNESTREQVSARLAVLGKLEEYDEWRHLDWADAEGRVRAAREERDRLRSGSTLLQEIEREVERVDVAARDAADALEALRDEITRVDERTRRVRQALEQDHAFITGHDAQVLRGARETYDALEAQLDERVPTSWHQCERAVADTVEELQQEIGAVESQIGALLPRLLGVMNEIRQRWPEATTEMDASVASLPEFRAFRDRVATDDLPAFEQEFKHQLNTNAIRELAGFNNWLRRQSDEIGQRVERINEALGAIDYSPGRYISLVPEPTPNQEIQAFRKELRDATNDALSTDDDRYSEQRFLDVQQIIERFRGREGSADADKAWTRRVTDVRNWFTFSASERDRGTDEEWEHYRDSDGKSGGQKEKLAYTILAASLAYQFGLEWGASTSRDFRFVVIDEAFGRGSDESTRYALRLFRELGLQLLIVTPLQKVRVIEPYVRSIGFIDNPTSKYSRVQTLTIEEFRERRARSGGLS